MYPLRPENGYLVEIMVCGGGEKSTKKEDGMINGKVLAPAYQWCHTVIDPESRQPLWLNHLMKYPRVGPNAVLLADGSAMIMGGAQTGFVGIPSVCVGAGVHPRALQHPDPFLHSKRSWRRRPCRGSTTRPLCFSTTPSCSRGPNPNIGIKTNNGIGDYAVQSGVLLSSLPYGGGLLPSSGAPKYIRTGSLPFTIVVNCFNCPKVNVMRRVKVTLAYPGFSTHKLQPRHAQRGLQVVRAKGLGPLTLTVKSRANKNIAPPTYYWLFVLIDGKPNRDGHAIWIK